MTTNLTRCCQRNLLYTSLENSISQSLGKLSHFLLSPQISNTPFSSPFSADGLAIYFIKKTDFYKMRTTSSSHQQVLYCICIRTKILCLPHPDCDGKRVLAPPQGQHLPWTLNPFPPPTTHFFPAFLFLLALSFSPSLLGCFH